MLGKEMIGTAIESGVCLFERKGERIDVRWERKPTLDWRFSAV